MHIGFDPHLDNINAAFTKHFADRDDIIFECITRPRWSQSKLTLPFRMAGFVVRFFFDSIRRYDLVHINSSKVGLIAWCASFFGARYVVTIHGCPHPELEKQEGAFKAFLSRVEVFCMKIIVKRAAVVSAISEFSQRELRERYGVKSIVVYNGVDPMTKTARPAARRELGLSGADPVYISVGRMIAYKNPLRILDIFLRNEAKNPNARLIYIGDGILREKFINYAEELGLSDRVIYKARVPFCEIALSYSAADYFISGCDTEGFGLAAIESLICGCRPVLPHRGAFPEIFRHASFFYNGDLSFKKGKRNEKESSRVLGEFSWSAAMETWETIYRKESKK
jgi:glycosyltransferase involved in cell wall biosynthesis